MSTLRDKYLGDFNNNNGISYLRQKYGLVNTIDSENKKKSSNNESKKIKLFKKGSAFDDGYQFGDVTKTVVSTVGDLATNIGKGFLNTVEGVTDAGQYLLADAAKGLSKVKALDIWDKNARDWLKEKANALEENAEFDSTGALFGDNEEENNNLFKKGWSKKLDEKSVIDDTIDSAAQGIGNVGAMAGLSFIGGNMLGTGAKMTSALTSFSTAFGNAKSEAYKNGADDRTSLEAATISGLSEAIGEQFFDGLPGIKVEGWGSKVAGNIANKVSKYFGTNTGKKTLKLLNATGEGFEEVISNVLQSVGNDITHFIDTNYNYGMEDQTGNIIKDSKNAILSDDSLESFFSATLTSAILGGANTMINNEQKKDIIKTYANEHNMSVDEATKMFNNYVNSNVNSKLDENVNFKDRVDLEEEQAKKILASIKDGNIDLKNYTSNVDTITSQINEYEALKEQNKITKEQEVELNNLKEKLNAIQNQNADTSTSSKAEVNLPTVQDIVNQEKSSQNSVNLPVYNQQSNITNSDKAILPTVNDFNSSNINMPTSNIKVDMAKIKPEILEDIKGFKLGDPSIESYKGSYIKTMLNEVGIKVPTAMNYVSEVRPDMSFTTTKDLTRQQYASIGNALQKLRSVDVTSVNNINNAIAPGDISQIKQIKGNIPINQELLNKYSTVKEIFENETDNFNGDVNIRSDISELNNLDVLSLNPKEAKKIAYDIFKKYNSKTVFENNGNKITVSRTGINESIEKIFSSANQRNLLKEHFKVFSDLGDIIEHATLVNQTRETKNRQNINSWNYYFEGLTIDGEVYDLEFDVRSLESGENQYRVQRLQKNIKKQIAHSGDASNNTRILPAFEQSVEASASVGNTNISVTPTLETSASYDNNITQSNENVKLPTINNMQNKEKNTVNMPPVENRVETESIIEEPQKLANILKERPVTMEEKDNWLKKLLTIKILDKGYYVDKLARQTKNKELSSKYDYMLMANGIAQQIIGNERFNPKTQKSEGKGLYQIFEPIENSGKLQEFTEYMYHKHNVSRMSLNTLFQEDNKPIFGDGVTSETSKKIVEDFENKNPEFIEWAEEVYNYNNFLLDVLVDYGVIGKEDKSYYNNKYPYYVPTIRATDKTKTQMEFIGKKASVNTPIKKAKGGNQDIIPLKEAMALRTMQTMNSALRNNFGMELLNTIETEAESNKVNIDDVVGDDIDAEEFLTKSTKKVPATLTVFQNGEKITFDIADEIYEALYPSKRYRINTLNTLNNIKRALVTEYRLTFMLTNPIKDIQDGALNSKHPKLFLKNIPEAIVQIKNKGDFYKLYLANGGSYETYFNYGEGYNKLPTKRGRLDPRKILDRISEINQSIEMAPRLAEFMASLEAGDSIETATYNSQEITTNFKRGGDWTKNLDANGVTFLNAGVQGTVKQIRNIQEAKSQGIKGMTNLAVKWSIAGLTPYILSQLIWGDDDDYEELSDYVKNNYYILWKNSDGTFVRIPKGRVMSVIQNLFKQLLDSTKGEKIDVKEFVELLQNQVLPSDPTESNIFSPLLDVAQNKTWYGGDLVPQRLQSLPEEEQYDESTDSISIWLGQKLGISPIKINYILQQSSGAIGEIILPMLTLEAENDSNSFVSNLLAPMKDKFTTDSVMNNQNISDLYDLDDELTKKSKSSNATTEDILKSKYINSIQTEMNKLTAEKRNIQNDTTLTNNEKYKQVREIQKQINQLAKEGLNNYDKVEIYDNYAKVGDKEYYKNNSDEWQKLDTTTAKYKTANQITTYDKYLTYQNEIDTIKDKYDNTNQRKNAVINYVNSLKLSIPQKAMLIKMNYSSFNSYNSQIIEYINNQDLSKSEKEEILTKLGFTVKDGRVYY